MCSTARCALGPNSAAPAKSPWPSTGSTSVAPRVTTPTGKTSSSPPPSTAADWFSDRRPSPTRATRSPPLAPLASGLDLVGRVVTLDALHTQDHTARHLVEHCRAHYVMTAVKSNRLNLLADLAALDWERPEVRATEHRTNDKRHGRLETRTCRVLDLSTEAQGCKLPHRRVAFRIERERKHRKTGVVQYETVHGLTSLPFEQASAERMLELVRGHWSIENRLHHVRDVSYDEDRCRVHTGHLPRNLACLTNLAISIVRLEGRFDYLPQAHRHYARCPHEAVRHLLEPATT